MRWKKYGVVWRPDGSSPWARTHAMVPTPYRLNLEVIRVYVTCLDDEGRGRPFYVDVSARDPTLVIGVSSAPLLDIGEPGCFDSHGVVLTSVVNPRRDTLYMYYAGFERCVDIRYRIFSGLAISTNGGVTFRRYSQVPVLDRNDQELFFRCGPCVLIENEIYKIWYVSGSSWTDVDGKVLPVYELRYLESSDGLDWGRASGVKVLTLNEDDEHGFGRPWVIPIRERRYEMHYSIRRRSCSAYRLGYAYSNDGVEWNRHDKDIGLDVSPDGFDSNAIMYSATINIGGKTYCFYNGNDFGADGFAVAELIR